MKKILIINPFGIGDVIFSTPLIDTIKKRYPDTSIGYVCNMRTYDVIKADPNLDRVFIFEKDEYRRLWQSSRMACLKKIISSLKEIKKERYDISIDLSLGYIYSMFLSLIGVRERLGFNYKNRGIFLTKKIDIDGFSDKHVIEYYLEFLKLLDIEKEGLKPAPLVHVGKFESVWADDFLKCNGVSRGSLIVGIIPGCGASWGKDANYRRWDRENFAGVADSLIDRYNARIVLFGDPKEIEICEGVQALMRNRAILSCGKTDVGKFLALLKKCGLVITNDGGPLHIAVGLGIKTVSIFGPVDDRIYGPYPPDKKRHIVISAGNMPCRPCYVKFKYKVCKEMSCLKKIKTGDVFEAAERLLGFEEMA